MRHGRVKFTLEEEYLTLEYGYGLIATSCLRKFRRRYLNITSVVHVYNIVPGDKHNCTCGIILERL